MSNSRNSVHLVGFTGSDLSVVHFEGDRKVARVNVAINERYRTRTGEESRQTQWFSLVFWNTKADEAIKLIRKGTAIAIDGKLVCQTYITKDGQKCYSTEIVVHQVRLATKPEPTAVTTDS